MSATGREAGLDHVAFAHVNLSHAVRFAIRLVMGVLAVFVQRSLVGDAVDEEI